MFSLKYEQARKVLHIGMFIAPTHLKLKLVCQSSSMGTGPCSQWYPVPNWGVFECDIAHCQSVAVLCMLYKIRCNPMHPLNDVLPGPCVPVRATCGSLVAHQYTYASPRCRRSTAGLLFHSQCPSGMILLTPC